MSGLSKSTTRKRKIKTKGDDQIKAVSFNAQLSARRVYEKEVLLFVLGFALCVLAINY